MSLLGPSFCSREEYQAYEQERLQGSELIAGSTYVGLVTTFSECNYGGHKWPVQFETVKREGSIHVARIALSSDVKVWFRGFIAIEDGYWLSPGQTLDRPQLFTGYFIDRSLLAADDPSVISTAANVPAWA